MKKLFILIALFAMLSFVACGETKEDNVNDLQTSTPLAAVVSSSDSAGTSDVLQNRDIISSVSEEKKEEIPEVKSLTLPEYSIKYPKFEEVNEDDEDFYGPYAQKAYFCEDFYFVEKVYDASGVFECYDYDDNLLYKFYQAYDNCKYKYLHKEMEGTDITSIIVNLVFLDPLYLDIETSSAKYGELCDVRIPIEGEEFKIKYLENISPDDYWSNIWNLGITFTAIYGDFIEFTCSWGDDSYIWKYYNVREKKFYDPGTVELPAMAYPVKSKYAVDEYDTTLWKTMNGAGVDGILLGGKADGSAWCYLDKNQNVIVSFADATGFSGSGFALVSYDCKTYYFMDKYLNVFTECPFEGMSASILQKEGKTFSVLKEDGSKYVIRLEK